MPYTESVNFILTQHTPDEGKFVYGAISLARMCPLSSSPLSDAREMWAIQPDREPILVSVADPDIDFVIDRCAPKNLDSDSTEEAMRSVLWAAQSMVLARVETTDLVPPVFLSDSPSRRPRQYVVAVKMLVRQIIDLPDVHVDLAITRNVWHAINQLTRRGISEQRNDPKMKSFAARANAAKAPIPSGVFLPIEVDCDAGLTQGALQLVRARGVDAQECILHLMDDMPAPPRGTRLRRIVQSHLDGELAERRADIAVIV